MQFDGITSLSDITSGRVLDFVSSVQNCRDHVATILRAFLKHLYDERIIDYRTATILENLKTRPVEKLPSYYTPMEIMGIEASIDRKRAMGKRDYAMLLLATRLGLRTSDIRLLQFSNLDWDNNLIHLQQYKTGKEIELPLLTDIGEAIIDYLRHARPKSACKYVFLRAAAPYEPMTSTGVYTTFNKYFRRSNLSLAKRRRGGHAMRHSLATNMLKKGTPITIISDSLGHTDSVSTMKYIHLNIDGLLKCSLEVLPVDENFYLQKGEGIYE
jgi:integrase